MNKRDFLKGKLVKAPKWTDEARSKLRATDSRVYLPVIARGNAEVELERDKRGNS
jgi:hypothetical protein